MAPQSSGTQADSTSWFKITAASAPGFASSLEERIRIEKGKKGTPLEDILYHLHTLTPLASHWPERGHVFALTFYSYFIFVFNLIFMMPPIAFIIPMYLDHYYYYILNTWCEVNMFLNFYYFYIFNLQPICCCHHYHFCFIGYFTFEAQHNISLRRKPTPQINSDFWMSAFLSSRLTLSMLVALGFRIIFGFLGGSQSVRQGMLHVSPHAKESGLHWGKKMSIAWREWQRERRVLAAFKCPVLFVSKTLLYVWPSRGLFSASMDPVIDKSSFCPSQFDWDFYH